jgi:flagellin-like hook-associated protein FlgL
LNAGVSNAIYSGNTLYAEAVTINISALTSLKTCFAANRCDSPTPWGVGAVGVQSANTTTSSASTADKQHQLHTENSSISQNARDITNTITLVQNTAANLGDISDALNEMKTLVSGAAGGKLGENEEFAAQRRIDDLLDDINRLANHTTDRTVNLLTAGAGSITIAMEQAIQLPTFDVTSRGLGLGESLVLKASDTSGRIDTALAAVTTARQSIDAILPHIGAPPSVSEPVTDTDAAEAIAAAIRLALIESSGMELIFQTDSLSQKALNLLSDPTAAPEKTNLPWHKTDILDQTD